jgi:AcrR family transcriptional regulator
MQEICAEARVSPGALYRYFNSKADIIAAIAEEEHASITPLLAVAKDGPGFLVMLEGFVTTLFERWFSSENAGLVADVLAEAARDQAIARRVLASADAVRDELARVIAQAQARGEIARDLPPLQLARLLMAAIDGVGLREVLQGGNVTTALADFRVIATRLLSPMQHPTPAPPRRTRQKETEELPG